MEIQKHLSHHIVCLLGAVCFSSAGFAATCESLAKLPISNGSVTLAVIEDNVNLPAAQGVRLQNLPPFCRVSVTLRPSSDSKIGVEIWMPVSGWSGRFEGTGNGGYAGSIQYADLAAAVRRRSSAANTDMGTATLSASDGDSLIGHSERWKDWGFRATHQMTIVAKQIIRTYYGREPDHSYFLGCSTGGEQGMMEAQRFPADYDGIVAGAPANNRTRLHMEILWDFVAAEKDSASDLQPAKLELIAKSVLKACSSAKAVSSDGFLSTPDHCKWDPQNLKCKSRDGSDCLTDEQIAAVEHIYEGPMNGENHKSIYPGVERGSEGGWDYLIHSAGEPRYDSLFKWVFGPSWTWSKFDFDRDPAIVDSRLNSALNATDPDLEKFKRFGHKLIEYHGWADALVPPRESINYYEGVIDREGREADGDYERGVAETRQFYRLFLVPGMAHCSGGPGLNSVDGAEAIELWVEKGIAPDKIAAQRNLHGVIEMTRPVCAFPQTALYDGMRDSKKADSFYCGDSEGSEKH